jgi:hypothetical protein
MMKDEWKRKKENKKQETKGLEIGKRNSVVVIWYLAMVCLRRRATQRVARMWGKGLFTVAREGFFQTTRDNS